MLKTVITIACACVLLTTAGQAGDPQTLKGNAAFGDWRDDKPGVKRLLTLKDLPPVSTPTYAAAAIAPKPASARPLVPEGFSAEMVASGLPNPRAMHIAPNGDLFVAESLSNAVRVYRIPAGTATPTNSEVYAGGLRQPFGIAFYPPGPNPEWIYIANSDSVVRFLTPTVTRRPPGSQRRSSMAYRGLIITRATSLSHRTASGCSCPSGPGRTSRWICSRNPTSPGFRLRTPLQASKLGSIANLSAPLGIPRRGRATVLSFDPDGNHEKIYATGLRNCEGMRIQPETGQLWCIVNERDELGDNTPFEYATRVEEGSFYGWPWYFIGGNEDPRHKGARPDLKDKVRIPDVFMQAHSAPLQMVFYEGDNFPAEYKGTAFVTMHGSWNRERRTGYKVVRLLFDHDHKPTGEYEDFMTGFVVSDKQVWGRPVGLAVAKDGSLFVSEDGNGTIWRVTHSPLQNGQVNSWLWKLPSDVPKLAKANTELLCCARSHLF
jgi:glucose/arabinose dehydrogenase